MALNISISSLNLAFSADPAFRSIVDPDTASKNNADPCGPGSATLLHTLQEKPPALLFPVAELRFGFQAGKNDKQKTKEKIIIVILACLEPEAQHCNRKCSTINCTQIKALLCEVVPKLT
jgi:hypothetical protein